MLLSKMHMWRFVKILITTLYIIYSPTAKIYAKYTYNVVVYAKLYCKEVHFCSNNYIIQLPYTLVGNYSDNNFFHYINNICWYVVRMYKVL